MLALPHRYRLPVLTSFTREHNCLHIHVRLCLADTGEELGKHCKTCKAGNATEGRRHASGGQGSRPLLSTLEIYLQGAVHSQEGS